MNAKKTDEQIENFETIEEENQCQLEETTLVLWDMLLAMKMFEKEAKGKDVQVQSHYNLRSKGPPNS